MKEKLNKWGKEKKPFIFLIDFECRRPIAWLVEDCSDDFKYKFQGVSNHVEKKSILDFHFDQYLFVVAYFPMIQHLLRVYNNKDTRLLDPELKKLAISTFVLSVLLSLCLIFFISDLIVTNF